MKTTLLTRGISSMTSWPKVVICWCLKRNTISIRRYDTFSRYSSALWLYLRSQDFLSLIHFFCIYESSIDIVFCLITFNISPCMFFLINCKTFCIHYVFWLGDAQCSIALYIEAHPLVCFNLFALCVLCTCADRSSG